MSDQPKNVWFIESFNEPMTTRAPHDPGDESDAPTIRSLEPVSEGRTLEAEILLLRLRSAVADKEWAIAGANMETANRDGWSCDWYAGVREAHAEIESILATLAGLEKEDAS